jgi:hypothetical protein
MFSVHAAVDGGSKHEMASRPDEDFIAGTGNGVGRVLLQNIILSRFRHFVNSDSLSHAIRPSPLKTYP